MVKAKVSNTTPKPSEVEKTDSDGFEIWDSASEKKTVNNPYWLRLGKSNMVFSKAMKELLGDSLLIAFNQETKTIRLKKAGQDQPSVIKCERTKIPAASFYKKFDIEINEEKAEKYEAIMKDDGCFYIQIK